MTKALGFTSMIRVSQTGKGSVFANMPKMAQVAKGLGLTSMVSVLHAKGSVFTSMLKVAQVAKGLGLTSMVSVLQVAKGSVFTNMLKVTQMAKGLGLTSMVSVLQVAKGSVFTNMLKVTPVAKRLGLTSIVSMIKVTRALGFTNRIRVSQMAKGSGSTSMIKVTPVVRASVFSRLRSLVIELTICLSVIQWLIVMSANSRFAMAVHTLALLARNQRAISSSQIAGSVNTNPVTIRKVLGSLNAAGLIGTQMGADGGAKLLRAPSAISLLEVYQATEQKAVFAFHPKRPNQQCDCGRNITGVLECVFDEAENAMFAVLHNKTIADVLSDIDERACFVADELAVS